MGTRIRLPSLTVPAKLKASSMLPESCAEQSTSCGSDIIKLLEAIVDSAKEVLRGAINELLLGHEVRLLEAICHPDAVDAPSIEVEERDLTLQRPRHKQ